MAKQRFRDIKQSRPAQTQHNNKNQRTHNMHVGVRDRIKATITDSFMLAMPILYIVFYLIFGGREGFADNMLIGWAYILLPLVIIQILFMSKSKLGQTPGMRAYSLSLIDLKTGKKPETGVIVYRQMLSLLSFFVLGWITMFFRKDSRTLHEIVSGTTLHIVPHQDEKQNKQKQ